MNKSENGNDSIHITTSDDNISLYIEINVDRPNNNFDGKKYEWQGIEFNVIDEDMCFATTFYNGNYYSIQANNYDEIVEIIKNIKE